MYLSGKDSAKQPLPPNLMMEDIMGDYREKTVTLENFPHEEGVKAVSIHPCRHAAVMKTLMARANNALKLRREKQKLVHDAANRQALGSLSGDMNKLNLAGGTRNESKGNAEDEWEVVETNDNPDEDEVAIRVDQYLVVFLKVRNCLNRESPRVLTRYSQFMASVIPNVEIDNTTSI
jgi:ubiquitin-like-conjugating enzyme ATG3